jgi:adenosylcobinamide kinase/adenosylcobinamide-phosphate guanylyltransferase
MPKTILITGGAASGKSRWAATYFEACDYVLYLRTEPTMNPDTMRRIEYSNSHKNVEWDILTGVDGGLAEKVADHKFVILDSLYDYTQTVMNRMCPETDEIDAETKKTVEKQVIDDIIALRNKVIVNEGSMIVITLETGFSVTPENRRLATYRQILGSINQRVANSTDEVYFSASGIQFRIK